MTRRRTITVLLDEALVDELDHLAGAEGVTRTDVVRTCLSIGMEHGRERGWLVNSEGAAREPYGGVDWVVPYDDGAPALYDGSVGGEPGDVLVCVRQVARDRTRGIIRTHVARWRPRVGWVDRDGVLKGALDRLRPWLLGQLERREAS